MAAEARNVRRVALAIVAAGMCDRGCRHVCRLHALFVSATVSHVKVGLIRLVVR